MDEVAARYEPASGEATRVERALSAIDRAAIALRRALYGSLDAALFTIDLLAEVQHDPETGRFMPGPHQDRSKGGKKDALGTGKASNAAREASKKVAEVEKQGDPKKSAKANREAADLHRAAEKAARNADVKQAHREAAEIHDKRADAHEAKGGSAKPEAKPSAGDWTHARVMKEGVKDADLDYLRGGMRDMKSFRDAYAQGKARGLSANDIATGKSYDGKGGKFEPITIHIDGGKLYLQDGRHRYTAAREAGATKIRARIREFDASGNVKSDKVVNIKIEKLVKSSAEKAPKASGVKAASYAKHLEQSGVKEYAIDIDKAHVKAIFGDSAPDAKTLSDAWGAHGEHGITSKIVGVHSSRMGLTPQIMFTSHLHDDTGAKVGMSQRIFSRDRDGSLVVKHENFFIDKKELQGKGFGAAATKSSVQAYEKMGVSRVKTDAAEVGRYTWPSLGFNWSKEHGESVKSKLAPFLASKGISKETAGAIAEKHAGKAWDVAALQYNGQKVGKEFLMSHETVIKGLTLDLNHKSESYQRAQERLGL